MLQLINSGANVLQLNSKTKIPSSVLNECLDNCIVWEECNEEENKGLKLKKDERKLIFNYSNILQNKNNDIQMEEMSEREESNAISISSCCFRKKEKQQIEMDDM